MGAYFALKGIYGDEQTLNPLCFRGLQWEAGGSAEASLRPCIQESGFWPSAHEGLCGKTLILSRTPSWKQGLPCVLWLAAALWERDGLSVADLASFTVVASIAMV